MPQDAADEIGAPEQPRLCPDHRPVIRSLSAKDHVGDEESARVARNLSNQCPQCRSLR